MMLKLVLRSGIVTALLIFAFVPGRTVQHFRELLCVGGDIFAFVFKDEASNYPVVFPFFPTPFAIRFCNRRSHPFSMRSVLLHLLLASAFCMLASASHSFLHFVAEQEAAQKAAQDEEAAAPSLKNCESGTDCSFEPLFRLKCYNTWDKTWPEPLDFFSSSRPDYSKWFKMEEDDYGVNR